MLLADKIEAAKERSLLNKLVNDETNGIRLTITFKCYEVAVFVKCGIAFFHYVPLDRTIIRQDEHVPQGARM